jgi:hypothetical protein
LTIAINTVSTNTTLRRRDEWQSQRRQLATWLAELDEVDELARSGDAMAVANLLAQSIFRNAHGLIAEATTQSERTAETMLALARVVRRFGRVAEGAQSEMAQVFQATSESMAGIADPQAQQDIQAAAEAELGLLRVQTCGQLVALLKTALRLDPQLSAMSVPEFLDSYRPVGGPWIRRPGGRCRCCTGRHASTR